MNHKVTLALIAAALSVGALRVSGSVPASPELAAAPLAAQVAYDTVTIDEVDVFYREAGPPDAPTILLLHGYPTSSHMFRNLMRDLGDEYHLLAPDYPGYGRSAQPSMDDFDYTFENLSRVVERFLDAKGVDEFSVYLMDYGAPIGLRLALRHPERVQSLIVQNGAAYADALEEFWDPLKEYWADPTPERSEALSGFHALEGLEWQYTHGTGDRAGFVSPDNWSVDLRHLSRPGNNEIQLALFYDYRTNVALYPRFQEFFRTHQPPTLVVYGKNDAIFPEAGARAYLRDLENVDFNLYDAGHFALETHGSEIGAKIREFMRANVGR